MKKEDNFLKAFFRVFGLALIVSTFSTGKVGIKAEPLDSKVSEVKWVESSGWTVTSYGDVNEALYSGRKIEIFNKFGDLLGFYRKDFFDMVKINGAGVGDGTLNDSTKVLHYDYGVDDGKTSYLSDFSLGAYDNPLVSWAGENPSIAVNPVLEHRTMVKLKDLGHYRHLHEPWVQELLLSKIFNADDKFFLSEEHIRDKKIDVYVGVLDSTDFSGPQSLYLEDVTALISSNPDLNRDGLIDNQDLIILGTNWLRTNTIASHQEEYNRADLNYDGIVNFLDYALLAEDLEKQREN